ncbi:hypothetical protein DSO57_1027628 [Entomophthora muscae]|uniref:Uncharacterized protein n=1 Tax=Entomophthora muscae TaxID=34485 RepID=A0ACC2T1S8_9FUNG|nr:hypothetical protein DSO57_1027628 [Entomophthora muscae]
MIELLVSLVLLAQGLVENLLLITLILTEDLTTEHLRHQLPILLLPAILPVDLTQFRLILNAHPLPSLIAQAASKRRLHCMITRLHKNPIFLFTEEIS